jgi:hypothetical protein
MPCHGRAAQARAAQGQQARPNRALAKRKFRLRQRCCCWMTCFAEFAQCSPVAAQISNKLSTSEQSQKRKRKKESTEMEW